MWPALSVALNLRTVRRSTFGAISHPITKQKHQRNSLSHLWQFSDSWWIARWQTINALHASGWLCWNDWDERVCLCCQILWIFQCGTPAAKKRFMHDANLNLMYAARFWSARIRKNMGHQTCVLDKPLISFSNICNIHFKTSHATPILTHIVLTRLWLFCRGTPRRKPALWSRVFNKGLTSKWRKQNNRRKSTACTAM